MSVALYIKLDRAFGVHTRPQRCPDCHRGDHGHDGQCGYCRCVLPPTEVSRELTLTGAVSS